MNTKRHYVVSQNEKLAVRVYRANSKVPAPAVLLGHGFYGIQNFLLPIYAQAGYHAITFDYRDFGESEGDQGQIIPGQQNNDIIAVLAWNKTQSYIDAKRIALGGTSLGGCLVIDVAVRCPEVKCVISLMGFASGNRLVTGRYGRRGKRVFHEYHGTDAAEKEPIRAGTDSSHHQSDDQMKSRDVSMSMQYTIIPRGTLKFLIGPYSKLTQPTLVVLAEWDKVIPVEHGLAPYQAITAPEACHIKPQAYHFDMFKGKHFENVIGLQFQWLKQRL